MKEKKRPIERVLRAVRLTLVAPIWLYQKLISPLIPSRCIYSPSCSEYGRQAVLRHGFAGLLLAGARLLRCVGGLYSGGEDPVPEEFSFSRMFEGYRKFWRGR